MLPNLTNRRRRDMLFMALSAAATYAVPGLARAQDKVSAALEALPAPTGATSGDPRLARLLADFAEEVLVLVPTSATYLGLDTGARTALKSQLPEISRADDARWAAQAQSMRKRLDTLDTATLGANDRIRYDTLRYAVDASSEGTRFSYGGAASGFFGGTAPFPVTQQDGSILTVPEFLDSQHSIANAADAEAYLARVQALARLLDQETARIADQDAHGIRPSNFITRAALAQLAGIRNKAATDQRLVTSLTTRTQALGIAGDWQARAIKLVDSAVYPALERQIAALNRATARATDVAGVHRLPDGAAYYEWALKLGTTSTRSAAEVHAIGLEQNRLIQSRMDAILKLQGISQGTVGQRMQALAKDPARLFADDESGRTQLIAFCNERLDAIRTLMPQISHLQQKAPLVIKRVPVDIENGAALGYMNSASLDGGRPAIYYINLKSTGLWPRYELSSLTAHEGIPGHGWQGAYLAEHQSEVPLIASMLGFNAFVEGWALYAEQLVDEFGLYANDPFSQLGYLQGQQFRACRLVVDTGIHAMKWSRKKAIGFLAANTGRSLDALTSEIDRYCVAPGQACGYKVGHNEILRQRDRAKAALGTRFDLAGFNDAVVSTGGVPLSVLPAVIDRFIAASKAA
jgi:uncharacterized protein (DUF885 family)